MEALGQLVLQHEVGDNFREMLDHWERIDRKLKRLRKYALQRIRRGCSNPAPLYIVGCQRSGTNILLAMLDRSLDTWTYNENHADAFDKFRIRSPIQRARLLKNAFAKWVVFKPLCDTQQVDVLLAEDESARALWAFRDYRDVANSAIREWGEGQLWMIEQLATQNCWHHWLAERMPDDRRSLIRAMYHDGMTAHTAAALKWYLRNEILFDLGELRDRLQLVKYESFVTNPSEIAANLFVYLGIPFKDEFVEGISTRTIGTESFPEIEPAVRDLCEDTMRRLDEAWSSQSQSATVRSRTSQ